LLHKINEKEEESDVEGYSTDDSRKRQRDEEENNDIKKKSGKTIRTPPKKKRSHTEMEDLKNMIQNKNRFPMCRWVSNESELEC
jgi:hypothetical protein